MTCIMKTFQLWIIFLHIQLGAHEKILDRLGAGVRKFHQHHLADEIFPMPELKYAHGICSKLIVHARVVSSRLLCNGW